MGSDGMDERGVVSPGHASSMLLLFFCSFFWFRFPPYRLFENGLGSGEEVRHDMAWHCIAYRGSWVVWGYVPLLFTVCKKIPTSIDRV